MKTLTLALGLLLVNAVCFAQEETEVPPPVQAEAIVIEADASADGVTGFSTMRVVASDEGGGPATMWMSSGDGAPMALPGFSFGNRPMDSFSLLSNPSVQKDLELVDEQMDQIRDIQKEFGSRIKEHIGDLSKGGFDPNRARDLGEVIRELKEEQKQKVSNILLAHQQDRLKQVALQMHMNSSGTANALSSDEIAEALGLTSEQIEQLKKKSKELQQRVDEKIKQLREEAKQELIGELSRDQQAKLKEMIGDKFKSESSDWQFNRRSLRRSSRSASGGASSGN